MKLIIAVIEDSDAHLLMDVLKENNFQVTKLASTGGFLLQGNTTLLIGIEDNEVEQVLDLIRKTCMRRKKLIPHTATELPTVINLPIEVETGGAIVFVLDVDQFYKI